MVGMGRRRDLLFEFLVVELLKDVCDDLRISLD
jgi:hypothetical protein